MGPTRPIRVVLRTRTSCHTALVADFRFASQCEHAGAADRVAPSGANGSQLRAAALLRPGRDSIVSVVQRSRVPPDGHRPTTMTCQRRS
jgi:hypothetical protein